MKQTVTIIKALADPGRLRIVMQLLTQDELCVCQITELLGFTAATVSRHISILSAAGVLTGRKAGNWVYYRLATGLSHHLIEWLRAVAVDSSLVREDSQRILAILDSCPSPVSTDRKVGSVNQKANLPKVLFLCTGNSCRSQMAEGWARYLLSGVLTPYSAGTQPHVLDPLAVRVMSEAGVDISSHKSKGLFALKGYTFDLVVTVCDSAAETCPIFHEATTVIHQSFQDPPRLAVGMTDQEQILDCYRRVRDEIRAFVETLPLKLKEIGEQYNVEERT